MPAKLTQEQFINKMIELHGTKYDFSETIYINRRSDITYKCPIHGEVTQLAHIVLGGSECPQCAETNRVVKLRNTVQPTQEEFIQRITEIHGDKYDFSKTIYKSARDKVIYECPEHGIIEQKTLSLLQGHGCNKCGSERTKVNSNGYGRSNFIKRANNKNAIFYIIQCYNKTESFYKVGITTQSIKTRYKRKDKMPYNYTIIKEVVGDPEVIFNTEVLYKRELREYEYSPLIPFAGSITECFSSIEIPEKTTKQYSQKHKFPPGNNNKTNHQIESTMVLRHKLLRSEARQSPASQ